MKTGKTPHFNNNLKGEYNFMSRDYNLMAHAGISDQDYVDLEGMPQEVAHTADLHLWMTYYIYLGNKRLETPEETERLLNDHFMNMRIQVSQRHWCEMEVPENHDGPNWDPEWYMDDSKLMANCRRCYERHPSTK